MGQEPEGMGREDANNINLPERENTNNIDLQATLNGEDNNENQLGFNNSAANNAATNNKNQPNSPTKQKTHIVEALAMEFLNDPTILGTGNLALNSSEELDDEEDTNSLITWPANDFKSGFEFGSNDATMDATTPVDSPPTPLDSVASLNKALKMQQLEIIRRNSLLMEQQLEIIHNNSVLMKQRSEISSNSNGKSPDGGKGWVADCLTKRLKAEKLAKA